MTGENCKMSLKTSPNSIWVMKSSETARMRGAYRELVRKPVGKSPLGRSRPRWEDNIKMDLKKQVGRAWTRLIWLRIRTSGGLL